MSFVVAIDGPSASGKGTIAKAVADRLSFDYLNTGIFYRAVAYFVLKQHIDISNTDALISLINSINFNKLEEVDLYKNIVSKNASIIAAIPEVRRALFEVQRSFAIGKNGVVIEGRDIGTIIFPDANIKIYITADIEERADRRFKQLQKSGESIIYDDVIRDLQIRDLRDSNRSDAPLIQGIDYFLVDTTNVDIDSVVNKVLELINRVLQSS